MGKSRKKQPGDALSDNELRRYAIFLIILCIAILLTAVVLISGRGRTSDVPTLETTLEDESMDDTHIPVIEPDTKEYFHDFGGSILSQDTVPEITQLMEQYFLSISECDMDTFMHLFTSQDTSQTEVFRARFEKEKQYIEGYRNISCYTAEGLEEDSYLAYVYYDTKFIGVETMGPALVQVYAVKCDDGQYRIYDQEISPELEEFLNQASMNEDVRLLISMVDRQMAEAMEADEELKSRIAYLKEGPEYMKGAEETDTPETAPESLPELESAQETPQAAAE